MTKIAIISDHVIIKYKNRYYTSATILLPESIGKISIYGRLVQTKNENEIENLNILPLNCAVEGYNFLKKGPIGYFLTITKNIRNLIHVIEQNDLIISKMPYLSSILSFYLCLILNKKNILYFIGFGGNNLRSKGRASWAIFFEYLISRVIKKSKYNIFVSDQLMSHYKPNADYHNLVLPEVQYEKYKKINFNLKLNNNGIQVGYIGRFSEEKGVGCLAEIFSGINNIQLNLIGDGDLKNKVLSDLNENNVKFIDHGWVENGEKLFELLKNLDFIVVPSKSEGFGLVVLEANLCGVPVIAKNVGGLQSLIINGKNGYLVNSIDEFKERILLLKMDGRLLFSLREQSRIYAVNFLDKNNYPEKMKSYINEILSD